MKSKEIFLAVLLGMVLPWLLFAAVEETLPDETEATQTTQETQPQTEQTQAAQSQEAVYLPVVMEDGALREMELDEYLTCVVLAEMPASFETEALKAQAVVARTYALKHYASGGKHDGGAVCTDASCCQAYREASDFLDSGGTEEQLSKVSNAVLQTHGQVLTYNGELIEATYFSCSGGRTEDALAVWGTDVPYLQAVDSPGEEAATHYIDTVSFDSSEFAALLGADLTGDSGTWLGNVTYTDGGGVDTIEIGGETYSGTTVRQLLGLRSTAFVMTAVGSRITVTTKGFGHRVGMSQYGAEAMAVDGSSYDQILTYYYQGTALEQFDKLRNL